MAKAGVQGGNSAGPNPIATSGSGAGGTGTERIPWGALAKPETDETVNQAVAWARGLPTQDVFTGGTVPARKTVAVPGTPERLIVTSTPGKGVVIIGLPLNTNRVVVGFDSSVRAADATYVGFDYVYPEDKIFIPVADANLLWLDIAGLAGEGVSWSMMQ